MNERKKIDKSKILPDEYKTRYIEDLRNSLGEELDNELNEKKDMFRRNLYSDIAGEEFNFT